jgi:putative spermidine/putrescine transport system substrate-binding protein
MTVRRSLIVVCAPVLFMLFVVSTTMAQGTAPSAQKALIDQASKTVVFAGPGGELGEAYKRIFADFTKETGITVTYLPGGVLDLFGRMAAERRRPSIDVYLSNGPSEARGASDGLYQQLDTKIVTALSEVYDLARVTDDMGVRFNFTNIGILYNKQKYMENNVPVPKIWADIWNPAVAGHVILSDPSGFASTLYIAYVNKKQGGSEGDPTAGIEYLATQKSKLLAIVRTSPERLQLMLAGQAWLTVDNGGSAIPETKKNPNFGFVSPEDGWPLFWNGLHAVKDGPNPIGAQLLINYMIGAGAQTKFANEVWVGPVNKNAKMSPELMQVAPDLSKGVSHFVLLDQKAIGDAYNAYRDIWNAKMNAK